jgi:catechol 2,3-dioxygenase-like lactoylglutathione lyase family enzyme
MPARDGFIPGVPCWVDASEPDPQAAVDFYGGLFGWEFRDVMPASAEGSYFIARTETRAWSLFDLSGEPRSGNVAGRRRLITHRVGNNSLGGRGGARGQICPAGRERGCIPSTCRHAPPCSSR